MSAHEVWLSTRCRRLNVNKNKSKIQKYVKNFQTM